METIYDVIVVGAGHAGCEAAHAAARMGCRTLLLTIDLDKLAHMSCNPSIGGPAKGHIVREMDALGGVMGRVTDETSIQIRMLNDFKGPAVQALRAQCDKRLYAQRMKDLLERTPNLDLKQAMVERIVLENQKPGKPANQQTSKPANQEPRTENREHTADKPENWNLNVELETRKTTSKLETRNSHLGSRSYPYRLGLPAHAHWCSPPVPFCAAARSPARRCGRPGAPASMPPWR